MKKRKRIFQLIISLFILFSLTALLFLFITLRYQDTFQVGTWVNGVYCTGRSIKQVNSELLQKYEVPQIVVKDKSGTEYFFDAMDFGYHIDMVPELRKIMDGQSSYGWVKQVDQENYYEISPTVTFDIDKIKETLRESSFYSEHQYDADKLIYLSLIDNGYEMIDHSKSLLDYEKAEDQIVKMVTANHYTIDLTEDVYFDMEKNNTMLYTIQVNDELNQLMKFSFTYILGEEKVKIDKKAISSWIETDEDGMLLLDETGRLKIREDAIADYVASLAEQYDTYGKERQYNTLRNDIVTLPISTYGNQINQAKEVIFLKDALNAFYFDEETSHNDFEREPVYIKKAQKQGTDDIGNNFIEVDMTAQTLYLILDGELFLETPVVTGSVKAGHETPQMICYVYSMRRNVTLTGQDYNSFVSYWCPIYEGIGLHDANWRKKASFGGDTYLTKGSHGCINIPPDIMPDIYENIYKGMPVILYY